MHFRQYRADNGANTPPNPRTVRTDAVNVDALQAKIDALTAENAALKAAAVASVAPAAPRNDNAPSSPDAPNLALRIKASNFLDNATVCDASRSDSDIARAAVAVFAPSENLAGKTLGYLEARIDIQLESRSAAAARSDAALAVAAGGTSAGEDDPCERARLANIEYSANLWKGGAK